MMKIGYFTSLLLCSCLIVLLSAASASQELTRRRAEGMPQFIDWLARNGFPGGNLRWDVAIQTLVANKDLSADEPLVTIPNNFILSVDKLEATPVKVCLEPESGLSALECLILFFLTENINSKSFWRPYFDVLPTEFSSLPLHWTSEELDQLQLFREEFVRHNTMTRELLTESWKRARDFIARHQNMFPPTETLTEKIWEWGALIFQTRSYSHPQRQTVSLVPVNDMLNHPNDWTREEILNFSQVWNTQDNSLTVRLNKPVHAGQKLESVFSTTMNSGQLLLKYGFVPEGRLYAADWVDTRASVLYPTDEDREEKMKILETFSMWPGQNASTVFFLPTGVPAATLGALRLSEMTHDQLAAFKAQGFSFTQLMNTIYTLDNEWKVSIRVERIARNLLSAFPTTHAQDEEILRTGNTLDGVALSRNALNAVRYRKLYKDILVNARRNIMERWLSLLSWQPQQQQQPPQQPPQPQQPQQP